MREERSSGKFIHINSPVFPDMSTLPYSDLSTFPYFIGPSSVLDTKIKLLLLISKWSPVAHPLDLAELNYDIISVVPQGS